MEILAKYQPVGDDLPEDYRLQMWKYARIFNNKFCAEIQTKNCIDFVQILAKLYSIQMVLRTSRNNPTNIVLLRGMPREAKDFANNYARLARKILKSA